MPPWPHGWGIADSLPSIPHLCPHHLVVLGFFRSILLLSASCEPRGDWPRLSHKAVPRLVPSSLPVIESSAHTWPNSGQGHPRKYFAGGGGWGTSNALLALLRESPEVTPILLMNRDKEVRREHAEWSRNGTKPWGHPSSGCWTNRSCSPPCLYPSSRTSQHIVFPVRLYDIWANWPYFMLGLQHVKEGCELGFSLLLWLLPPICFVCLLLARIPRTTFERCLKSITMDLMNREHQREVSLPWSRIGWSWKIQSF